METSASKKKHWAKTLASLTMVLLTMPLGHALMIVMEQTLPPSAVHCAAFALGAVGLLMVVVGVFAKGDTRQTLWGFFGGLLFWTGWVEFLFQYYALRFGVQPEIEAGVVVTKPEYRILPATFGLWAMVMLMYIFSTRNGCDFINWWQKRFFGRRKPEIAARPMTRHTSIVTFMELNMILWTSYLALMFCYDKNFLGDHHPVTFALGLFCLVSAALMFAKQIRIGAWGANIRMSIATVIVFWTPVEILGRVNFFNEIWIDPANHIAEMSVALAVFIIMAVVIIVKNGKKAR